MSSEKAGSKIRVKVNRLRVLVSTQRREHDGEEREVNTFLVGTQKSGQP